MVAEWGAIADRLWRRCRGHGSGEGGSTEEEVVAEEEGEREDLLNVFFLL